MLCLLAAAPAAAQDNAIKSLMYSRWVDIGPGRAIAQLKPSEIAQLRDCRNWTMYFVPAGDGVEQVFIAGMTMGTTYPKVLVSQISGETIFVLVQPDGRTHDTLHLSGDGQTMTQMSPPFRPHTYLRCAESTKTR